MVDVPSGSQALSSPEGDEVWRVFVLLRDRPGVYERSIRSSGPLEAQHAIEMADHGVLETLGAQFLGRSISASPSAPYRRVQAVNRRFAAMRRRNSSGSTAFASVPVVEVMVPEPDGEGEGRLAPRS
jgi:hypothetical protein